MCSLIVEMGGVKTAQISAMLQRVIPFLLRESRCYYAY